MMTIKKTLSLLSVAASMMLAVPAFATTYTWTGAHAPNNWTDPKNWDLQNNYPGAAAGDTAIFNNGSSVTITSNIPSTALAALTVTSSTTVSLSTAVSESIGAVTVNYGSTLTIQSGLALTITSTADIYGLLVMNNVLVNNGTFTTYTVSTNIGEARFVGVSLNSSGGILNNYGRFEARDGTCSLSSNLTITDNDGSGNIGVWRCESPSSAGTLQFNASYTGANALSGPFDAGQNCMVDVQGFTVTTTGTFTPYTGTSVCSHVNASGAGVLNYNGGSHCP